MNQIRSFMVAGLLAVLMLCGLVQVAEAQVAPGITAVDPIPGPLGYPKWIQDSNGVKLQLCTDTSTFCVAPADGEAFWWMAEARPTPLVAGGNARLVLAWEAAYGGDGSEVNGNQIAFARLRIRVDVPEPGTYTVTHPYGTKVFENVTVADGINFTEDIGGADPARVIEAFKGLKGAKAAPALVWPDYKTNPALVDANGARYVGDNNTPHIVTGSPTGNNFFQVDGPKGITTRTDEFIVMGKLDDGIPAPVWEYPNIPAKLLLDVGPVNRAAPFNPASPAAVTGSLTVGYPVGFPLWYDDGSLQLTICQGNDAMCISEPVDPLNPNSVALGVGGEAFFWSAEAEAVNQTAGIDGLLVIGLEGAFGGDGTPKDGNQIVFTRIRIRVDTPVAGIYTITHPFGIKEFDVPAGKRAINYTEDIGGASPIDPDLAMEGALYGNFNRFLTWTDYQNDPQLQTLLTSTGNQYIGIPGIPHEVTGSPTGNNVFRIEGPGGIVAETTLFSVSGKLFDPTNAPGGGNPIPGAPVAVDDAVMMAPDSSVDIALLSNDTLVGTAPVIVILSPTQGPLNGTVALNADNTATYTPDAGFVGVDTFQYRLDAGGLLSNTATVSIQVTAAVIAPVAVDDAVTTNQDTAVPIQVLANDNLSGADPAVVTIDLLTTPTSGTVALNANNTATYTPKPGSVGTDTFSYQINAGGVLSNAATVTIQVNAAIAENMKMSRGIVNTRGRVATIRGPLWILMGRGTPNTTLNFYLGPNTSGALIGSAKVNRRGIWRFVRRVPVTQQIDATSTISIQSSGGGALVNQPLRVLLPRPPRSSSSR